jgi:hypothetical protein
MLCERQGGRNSLHLAKPHAAPALPWRLAHQMCPATNPCRRLVAFNLERYTTTLCRHYKDVCVARALPRALAEGG